MQCTITFEFLHIKLYALFKASGAWPVVPHIPEVLDTAVKYLFGPLFCSLLVADLNCLNSTPVSFDGGNNSEGFKFFLKSMLELFLLWIYTGECGKYKIWQTKDCNHWGKTYCERFNNSCKCAAWNNNIIPFHVCISKALQEMENISNFVMEFCKADSDVVCFAS